MFTGTFRQNRRVSPAELKMRPRGAVTIAEHVEDRNAAAEMLRGASGIVARKVEHAVKTVRVACETKIRGGVSSLFGDNLKLPAGILKLSCLQVGFGGNQPRLADRLAVS